MSASAGTFIGAALETAGQFYQSYVLDLITWSIPGLVVLCFVIGAMASLVAVVARGGAKSGLLLLLGPALYLAAVFQRNLVPPVEWTQARTADQQASVSQSIENIDGDTKYKPRPSSLFMGFDRLVSGFVSQTSNALRTTSEKVDLAMVSKTQLLGFLMSSEISDPGLKELLHLSLLGECRGLVQSGQEMSDPRNRPEERCEWAKSYSEIATKTTFRLTPNAANYVAALAVDVPMLLDTPVVDDLGAELDKVQTDLAKGKPQYNFAPFNGCDLTAAGGSAASDSAAATAAQGALLNNAYVRNQIMTTVGGRTIDGTAVGLPRSSGAVESLSAFYEDREAKINEKTNELSAENFTCHEIWNITYAAMHYEAAMSLEVVKAEGEKQGFDPVQLEEDLAAMSGVSGSVDLIRAISRKLFRLENANGSASAIVQEYANRGPDIRSIKVENEENINATIRQETRDAEWTGQASLLQTAMMLPYYQGLIIFFLSISFPFFALLLVVPGRSLGFCMWFGLWFWVKSWDIGYALVSMLDRVLYSIFVVKMDSGYVTSRTTLDLDFSAAIAALRDVDPTFDVGTYYNIIAVCILAVPVISAQLVVQIAAGVASIVRGQLLQAQESAIKTANTLNAQRALGTGPLGDITAKVLKEAASSIPLNRAPRGVTIIDDAQPSVMPARRKNLIATSGRRLPAGRPSPTNRLPIDSRSHSLPRREFSRWDVIDYSKDLSDPEVVDDNQSDNATKAVESTTQPRIPLK